ncbi:MAG: triose-phosphate isomerase [Oscillospiraceae bacterium]|jgi:triosephosphate isomerase|nr:triose-phosphate isomerase [Oscillospiraceae bacterium]
MKNFIIAGNWKMNCPDIPAFAAALPAQEPGPTVIIAPPFPFIPAALRAFLRCGVGVSAQDVSAHERGAFTGEVSAEHLASLGARYAIVGHSERRAYHGETNELVCAKASVALRHGLTPIICVGETMEQRRLGDTEAVLTRGVSQSANGLDPSKIIVAYEPVWAIGTGIAATALDAERAAELIAELVPGAPVLYGGSVTPDNARELLSKRHISGALIGGASLGADSLGAIINTAISLSKEAEEL